MNELEKYLVKKRDEIITKMNNGKQLMFLSGQLVILDEILKSKVAK